MLGFLLNKEQRKIMKINVHTILQKEYNVKKIAQKKEGEKEEFLLPYEKKKIIQYQERYLN